MAQLGAPYLVPKFNVGEKDYAAQYRAEEAWFDQLWRTSLGKKDDNLDGCVIRFQVADGYALYYVKSEKPLVLQHIAIGDAYAEHPALIRGLRVADVRRMVEVERSMAKLFAKQRSAK